MAELLAKAGDGDFLRSVAEAVVQLLIETDVDGLIGAGRHELSGEASQRLGQDPSGDCIANRREEHVMMRFDQAVYDVIPALRLVRSPR